MKFIYLIPLAIFAITACSESNEQASSSQPADSDEQSITGFWVNTDDFMFLEITDTGVIFGDFGGSDIHKESPFEYFQTGDNTYQVMIKDGIMFASDIEIDPQNDRLRLAFNEGEVSEEMEFKRAVQISPEDLSGKWYASDETDEALSSDIIQINYNGNTLLLNNSFVELYPEDSTYTVVDRMFLVELVDGFIVRSLSPDENNDDYVAMLMSPDDGNGLVIRERWYSDTYQLNEDAAHPEIPEAYTEQE